MSTAVVAVLASPGPAQAATIPAKPTNDPVCGYHPQTPGNPLITSFARTPSGVDVRSKAKTVTYTIKATDSTKNINAIYVTAISPLKSGITRTSNAYALKRTAGTAKNGTWKVTVSIPRWTINGTWKITQVYIADAGNGANYYTPNGGGFSTKPWNSAWPKSFSVTSKPDLKVPTLSSVKLSKSSVNTSLKVQTIGVTVKAKDDLSGVAFVSIYGIGKVGTHNYLTTGGILKRHAGTVRNGTFTGTITVPRWVGNATWKLSLSIGDAAGNGKAFSTADIKKKGTSTFKVKSKTDNTKPVLRSLVFVTKSVDARTKIKPVTITAKLTDTGSGVTYAVVSLQSPSGAYATGFLTRVHGTAYNGTFSGKAFIDRCSEPGTWTVLSVSAADVAGNFLNLTAAQVKAKHFTPKLSVKALDWQAPKGTVPATVPHAGSIVVTFSEPTLWRNGTAQTAISVQDAGTFSSIAGVWTCKSASNAAVTCDGTTPVATASFNPNSDLTAGHKYTVTSFSDIYDTAFNGPISLYGNSIKAT